MVLYYILIYTCEYVYKLVKFEYVFIYRPHIIESFVNLFILYVSFVFDYNKRITEIVNLLAVFNALLYNRINCDKISITEIWLN